MAVAIAVIAVIIIGTIIGMTGMAIGMAILFHTLRVDSQVIYSKALEAEYGLRRLAEEKATSMEAMLTAQKSAIESNALPWVTRNDRLEARYENETLDRLENPSFYNDAIPGLGQNA